MPSSKTRLSTPRTATDTEVSETDGHSRAHRVYEYLHQSIREGRFANGERIREEEVARSLGVSRTPVREAITRLQDRGLFELSPKGIVVARLGRPQIIELYAFREILEGSAARLAAQHASPSEIAQLKEIVEQFHRYSKSPARLVRVNRTFHDAIYEASHNRYLQRSLAELQDTLMLLPATTFEVKGRPLAAVTEHRKIVAGIERRNPDEAEAAARAHILSAQQVRLHQLFQDD